jgi:gamma-glutamylcyclotransferase
MAVAAPNTFLYFAYGSNMASRRLRAPNRCPSANPLGMAELRGYELCWQKPSKDGSGKCTVLPGNDRDRVLGVLFSIATTEQHALDAAEGQGKGYEREQMAVWQGNEERQATLYVATSTSSKLKPYTWYKAWVVAGAKEHGLPADYIARLEAAPAIEDPDQARHEEETRQLRGE